MPVLVEAMVPFRTDSLAIEVRFPWDCSHPYCQVTCVHRRLGWCPRKLVVHLALYQSGWCHQHYPCQSGLVAVGDTEHALDETERQRELLHIALRIASALETDMYHWSPYPEQKRVL